MSEMINRVARAVCVQGGFDPDTIQANDGPLWKYYVPGAKAAVEAMKEATYEMRLEGQSVVNLTDTPGHYEYISRDEAQEIWETMIEEALK